MITRVQVKNFRNLADVDVELGPLTVLVGRNGAGKSTFLDVLRFVRDALSVGLDNAIRQRNGIMALRRWSQNECYDVEVTISVESHSITGDYSFTIRSQAEEYHIKHEACRVVSVNGKIETYEVSDGKWIGVPHIVMGTSELREISDGSALTSSMLRLPLLALLSSQGLMLLLAELTQLGCYSLYPNALRRPQLPANKGLLLDTGENLAEMLRQIEKDQELRNNLIAALKQVVGGVDDVRVKQVGSYLVAELKHQNDSDNATWFDLSQESDGTLRMLGLLTALYQPFSLTLTAIEEPELAIHPGALPILADVIREASQRTQVLITTQSPDLISRFNADELRVVERVNGVSRIGPVDEVQRGVINDQLFSAGDLLRIEGLHVAPTAEAA